MRSRARPRYARRGQGRFLFKEGDTEKRTYYLVSGTVDLLTEGKIVGTIKGGTPDAKHPLAPVLPRRCSARVATDGIKYLSIDSDLLDVLITWDQTGQYEVGDLRAGRRHRRRLDDAAAAEPRVPQDPAGEPPGGLHAHAAHDLLGRRHGDPAGRRRRLLLRDRRRPLRRDARDAAQSRRRKAGRARQGRYLRRGGAHFRRKAQRDRVDADRRRRDAARQGRFQYASQRADAAMGRRRGGAGGDRPRRRAGSTCACRANTNTSISTMR